jgi:hypothetical protein
MLLLCCMAATLPNIIVDMVVPVNTRNSVLSTRCTHTVRLSTRVVSPNDRSNTRSKYFRIESSQPQSPQPQQPQQPPSRSQSLRRRFPRSGKRKMLELPLSSSNSSSKCNILAKKRRIECPVSSDMDPVQLSQDSMYENLAAAKKISVSQQPLYSTSSEA